MIVPCPNCSNRNEVDSDSSFDDIYCSNCGSSYSLLPDPHATTTILPETRRFGHFRLIDVLGDGAFGTVWKAADENLQRIVALKVPRRQSLERSEISRFLREARAAAQLRHPHVVSVHEVGEHDKTPYIVSDFIEGVDLKQWLKSHSITPAAAASLCEKIADAVHHAHEHGIVHRDLKPGNIMIGLDGEPHVMDFGLAKRDTGDATMTLEGAIVGTPSYMSPEQARGKGHAADRCSDVYSIGVILFELLTGELPFRGEKQSILFQIITEDPPSARKLNARVPYDLDTICLKCMEKEPERRYGSCRELADEFARFRSGRPIHARPVGTVGRILRWYSRNPQASLLTAGGYMACLMTILTFWGICGIVSYATNIHKIDHPWRAVCELLFFMSVFYLPGLIAGVKILNGQFRAIWVNLTILFFGCLVVLVTALRIGPEVEALSAANDSDYVRYQLATLLGTMLLLGLVLHLIALVSGRELITRRG